MSSSTGSHPLFTDEQLALLDDLVREYPKQGRWDDILAMWAYAKGFQAGEHRAKKEKKIETPDK